VSARRGQSHFRADAPRLPRKSGQSPYPRWLRSCLWVAVLLGGLTSCGKKDDPPPRSRDEIFLQRLELPAVYLTAKSHKRIIERAGLPLFTKDPETGEVVWPALCCTNPDCPGRRDGEPLLFIEPDADYACPQCAVKRNLAAETEAVRQQYINWVRPYVLPETAEKLKQLDAELQRRVEYERIMRVAPTPNKPPPPLTGGPQPTKADPASRP
jgi:hypothetical protein